MSDGKTRPCPLCGSTEFDGHLSIHLMKGHACTAGEAVAMLMEPPVRIDEAQPRAVEPQQPSPGPWRWATGFYGADYLAAADGRPIFESEDYAICAEAAGIPPNGADARLIAAAPELAEALRKALRFIDDLHCAFYGRDATDAETVAARALLARIGGKE